ncbi:MAG: hypothetical protein ABWY56_06720 [Propionibacteriaceae bacterium]
MTAPRTNPLWRVTPTPFMALLIGAIWLFVGLLGVILGTGSWWYYVALVLAAVYLTSGIGRLVLARSTPTES